MNDNNNFGAKAQIIAFRASMHALGIPDDKIQQMIDSEVQNVRISRIKQHTDQLREALHSLPNEDLLALKGGEQ